MGNRKHGAIKTRLYIVWGSMRARCENHNKNNYERYGAKGVSVCAEWHDFVKFRDWALANGYNEDAKRGECTLDRIDPNGDYEPSNCRFVSMKVQQNNKKNNRTVEYNGKMYTVSMLADEYNLNRKTLTWRLDAGWSIEDAVTKPVRNTNCGARMCKGGEDK